MSIVMDEKEMRALTASLAKNIKTEKDLSDFSHQLKKMTVEAAFGVEMEEHLGYAKYDPEGYHTGNSRNGYSGKILEGQTRLTEFDSQILSLYAKGMTTRDTVETFKVRMSPPP